VIWATYGPTAVGSPAEAVLTIFSIPLSRGGLESVPVFEHCAPAKGEIVPEAKFPSKVIAPAEGERVLVVVVSL
jgi:hypothetical protein